MMMIETNIIIDVQLESLIKSFQPLTVFSVLLNVLLKLLSIDLADRHHHRNETLKTLTLATWQLYLVVLRSW